MKRCTLVLTTAGFLTVAAAALKPDLGLKAADRYDRVAAHPGLEQLSAALFFVAGAAFVLGGIPAFADRPGGRGSGTAAVGAVLTAFTGLWQSASLAAFGMWFALVFAEHTPRSAVLPLLNNEVAGMHLYDVALSCELLGPALLAVGLHRAGRLHWGVAVLWVVGIIGDGATEFVSRPGQVAALAVATVALFLIGRALDAVPATVPLSAGSEPVAPRR